MEPHRRLLGHLSRLHELLRHGHGRRIEAMQPGSHYAGTTQVVNGNPVWTGKVALAPEHILTQPLRWRRPRRIFVNSMGDLFHEAVPDAWIDQVFAVMALCPQHTFQVLTKRSARCGTTARAARSSWGISAGLLSRSCWSTPAPRRGK